MSRVALRDAQSKDLGRGYRPAGALDRRGRSRSTSLEDALAREEVQKPNGRGSEYLALATQKLRNPLASIYGIAVTLDEREHELAEPQREALLNALLEQAARIQGLAEQLLDLSRLDLTAIEISPEPVRLRPGDPGGGSLAHRGVGMR